MALTTRQVSAQYDREVGRTEAGAFGDGLREWVVGEGFLGERDGWGAKERLSEPGLVVADAALPARVISGVKALLSSLASVRTISVTSARQSAGFGWLIACCGRGAW
jgi:hypothetical protein